MEESRIDKRKAKNQKRLMVVGVVLIAIIALIVIALNLSSDSSSVSDPLKEASKKEAKTFRDDNFSTVLINPKENKGASVNISGKVLNSKKKGKIWRVEIYQDQENDDGLTVIESGKDISADKGDIIRVIGTIKGEEKIKDSKKDEIKVPVIEASSISNTSKPQKIEQNNNQRLQEQGMM